VTLVQNFPKASEEKHLFGGFFLLAVRDSRFA
jgi:hypothetical protein